MASVEDKYFIVTGANNGGIGFELAELLCSKNAHVTLACRNSTKMEAAIQELRQVYPGADVTGILLDLADLSSVEKFATQYRNLKKPLHCLILNAAVNMPPFELTKDGYELTFQVNHLAQAYLTLLLLDVIKKSSPSRVVVVGSNSYQMSCVLSKDRISLKKLSPLSANGYWGFFAYNNSKFCNGLFARKLNKLYSDYGITAHCVHPGNLVRTKLSRYNRWLDLLYSILRPFSETVESAAEMVYYIATSDDCLKQSGRHWWRGWFGRNSVELGNEEMADALWVLTCDCLKESRDFCLDEDQLD